MRTTAAPFQCNPIYPAYSKRRAEPSYVMFLKTALARTQGLAKPSRLACWIDSNLRTNCFAHITPIRYLEDTPRYFHHDKPLAPLSATVRLHHLSFGSAAAVRTNDVSRRPGALLKAGAVSEPLCPPNLSTLPAAAGCT